MSNELQNQYELHDLNKVAIIHTYKSKSSQTLITSITVSTRNGSFLTHELFKDYQQVLAQSPCPRVSAKLVANQHSQVLTNIETILTTARGHYVTL